ncbi:MAG: hypothetical protein WCK46_00260 [Candidatus Adlerbacteria bacterium]
MNTKKCLQHIFWVALLAVIFSVGIYFFSQQSFVYHAAVCDYSHTSAPDKIECWYGLLDTSLATGGAADMLHDYAYLYSHYPNILVPENCHADAHWMGDQMYSKLLHSGGSLETVDFPETANVCTFGVPHGFFMHLFADHPNVPFVTATCSSFETRFSNIFPTINVQCYHAAGHGFVLAHAHDTSKDARQLAVDTLGQCDTLPNTLTDIERQTCYRGVFTALLEWAAQKQHGLSFDKLHPFALCTTLAKSWKRMCYAGVADRFFREASLTVPSLIEHIAQVEDPSLRVQAFRPAMRVLILRAMPHNSYLSLIPACATVSKELFVSCITIFPSALFTGGFPEQEYPKALALCASNQIHALDAEKVCYLSIAKQLALFYPPEKLQAFTDPHVQQAIAQLIEAGKLTTTELDLPNIR